MSNRVSVYPQAGHHDPDSLDCWCKPEYFVPCDECEEEKLDCWRCGGRHMVQVDRAFADAADEPIIIVHACNICRRNLCTCEAVV